jgi:hypothetical protein
MSKMGSHDPFGYLKQKLWPKERSGVELPIWLPTTKIQETPWFPCVKVACYIPLESSRQGLQLCFRTHMNQRSSHKVMGHQSCNSPNFGNFERTKWHLGASPMAKHKEYYKGSSKENTIKGKVMTSPKSGPWFVLWIHVCPWFVYASKVMQLCINQLVVWFV